MKPWLVKFCLFTITLLLWAFWHRLESPHVKYPCRVRCSGGEISVESPKRQENVN